MYLALQSLVSVPSWQNARAGGLVPGALVSGCDAASQIGFHVAAAHQEQASVLALGEWPRRDGARSASKDVRLIVVASAAAIPGASASLGEVSPFHR